MLAKLFLLALFTCTLPESSPLELNNRPIVGLLLQEAEHDTVNQYVTASYVKYIEMAGARVVPIFIKRSKAYYEKVLNQVNGVLMPGGDTEQLHTGYSEAADLIIETAIDKFNAGIHFPIWGTCNSFQKFATYFTGNRDTSWSTDCNVEGLSLPLNLPQGITAASVRMFAGSERIVTLLSNFNVTANYHVMCLKVDTFKSNHNLSEQFTLVSTSTYDGMTFVSTLEHKKYPIYGTQWHPEKPIFEWWLSKRLGDINHDWRAIQVGQHFANFLVNESRKNGQHFANKTEEAEALIYNYSHKLTFLGKVEDGFAPLEREIYLWPIKEI